MGTICVKEQKSDDVPDQNGFPIKSRHVSVYGNDGINWEDLVSKNGLALYEDLKRQYSEAPVEFLINNIAMSVQFLKDFDRDKQEIYKAKDAEKDDFDDKLSEAKKSCHIAGTVFSKVNDYVSVKSWRRDESTGTWVPVLTPIIPDQYYLCYTNIELDSQMREPRQDGVDSMNYANLNDRTYRGALEGLQSLEESDEKKSKHHPGYVKVVCFEPKGGLVPKENGTSSTASSLPTSPTSPAPPSPGKELESRNEHVTSAVIETVPKDKIGYEQDILQDIITPLYKSPRPPPHTFKTDNFLEDLEEEDEDEDGEEAMAELKSKLIAMSDNYVAPSSSRARQGITAMDLGNVPVGHARLQERRPSGFLPSAQIQSMARQKQIKEKLYKNKLDKIDNIPPKSAATTQKSEEEHLKPPTQNLADDKDVYVLARRQPLYKSNNENPRSSRGSIIPENCFEKRTVEKSDEDEEEEDGENEEDDKNNDDEEEETRLYLSSEGMMKYFQQQFPSICDKLDKPQFKVESNRSQIEVLPPDIYCRVVETEKDEYERHADTKFTPTIECSGFPGHGLEWKFRARTVMKHKKTMTEYRWPTSDQKEAVLTLGFNIVPVGFTHPRRDMVNKNMDIEWQIRFIKAEHFLSKNLHYPKIKVYLLLLVLFKKYIEPLEGITEEHLRHLFYKKVEEFPTNWTEENAGEKLINLLQTLEKALKDRKIVNYFLPKSNMLASVANHKINNAHEKVFRILENPVFYLLAAIHDLHYEKNFYPSAESLTEKLFKVLNEEKASNLWAINTDDSDDNRVKSTHIDQDDDLHEAAVDEQGSKDQKEKRDKYQRRMSKAREKIEEEKRQKQKQLAEVLESEESVRVTETWPDTDMKLDKDENRWMIIISHFLRHFLDMADKSNSYRNQGQAYMYYQQANNLYKKLVEMGFADEFEGGKFPIEKLRLTELEDKFTEMSKKDYWNISFSHPKFTKNASFRADTRLSIPLPTPPSDESPIPGTKRPDEESLGEVIDETPIQIVPTIATIETTNNKSEAEEEQDENEFFVTKC